MLWSPSDHLQMTAQIGEYNFLLWAENYLELRTNLRQSSAETIIVSGPCDCNKAISMLAYQLLGVAYFGIWFGVR